MSAAAQREESIGVDGLDAAAGLASPAHTDSAAALRQLAAERVAAHRNRRAANLAPSQEAIRRAVPAAATGTHGGPVARPSVRDAVAARYRQSPSYQEFLAAEAERALEKAQAEAEVATRNALAVAAAQRQLLDEIEHWNQQEPAPAFGAQAVDQPLFIVEPFVAEPFVAEPFIAEPAPAPRAPAARRVPAVEARYAASAAPAPLTVQLFGDLPQNAAVPARAPGRSSFDSAELDEMGELDGEIAFRLAPEFAEHFVEMPIQANIIEFPRQLVATRKARPRLAEGPLREDGTPEPQLRIFEVEPEQVSTAPEAAPASAPEWQSMVLSPAPPPIDVAIAAGPIFDTALDMVPQAVVLFTAPVSRRVMAMAVDTICVFAGFTAFCTLAARLCGASLQEIPRPALGVAAVVALLVVGMLYQMLFFCFNEATPGMVYARLGLCTFADANPSRRAVRRRMWATALAVSPLGLGLLWMLLDPDRLGWHDRISRMYPRAY